MAANQRGVRVGAGGIRDFEQVEAFGRLREGRAVNAGRGQHRNGNLKRMILDVGLELRPVAHTELLQGDLGSDDGVDGVNQHVFALELRLEVHRGVAQHVLNVQGLGAEHEGVAVGRLLVGVFHAVHAGTAFHVHNLNRHAQDILEQRGHRAQGGVSAAADAPRADQVNLALELEFGAGAGRKTQHHHESDSETYKLLHRFNLLLFLSRFFVSGSSCLDKVPLTGNAM